jgi:zinc protease
MKTILIAFCVCAILVGPGVATASDNVVLMRVADDPTVSFRVLFNVGSQDDPEGKEGLAALTASLIAEGSTSKHSYEEVLALLYPMASSISDQVDKEMTVFSGRTHVDNLDEYYSLFKEVLLEPAFAEEDFKRIKNDYLNYIKTTIRYSQDEELGKEVLYEFVFEGTPYHHNEEGWVTSLESITLDDVKSFYKANYSQANLVIGLGGGFSGDFAGTVAADFKALPKGKGKKVPSPSVAAIDGLEVTIVEKDAQSTAISFGFPIDVVRGDRDFYALAIATAWLGEHRNSFSHLYQVIREARGLNYGDYAYVEHFPQGYRRQFPPPNVARSQQIFQVWLRPVPNDARVFAFRAAVRELEALVNSGMSREEFDLTKKFLKGYILHYAPTTSARLGYALDDRFYGLEKGHWETYAKMLDELTLEDVNAALKKHFTFKNMKVVFITADAVGLKKALVDNEPSPISYPSEKPAEILEEDKAISTYPLSVDPEKVTIKKVEEIFEG